MNALKVLICVFVMVPVIILKALAGDMKSSDIVFYVSSQGSDLQSGTSVDKAFASFEKARDAIRALKTDGELNAPVVVYVLGGKYELNEPFVLTPKDSGTKECPISYCAFENDKPIVSGESLQNNQLLVLQGDAENNSYVEYVNFSGLSFEKVNYEADEKELSAAINFDGTINCTFTDNCVSDVRGNALKVTGAENLICGNKLSNIGGGRLVAYGIFLGNHSLKNRVQNNIISFSFGGICIMNVDEGNRIVNNFFIEIQDHVVGVYNSQDVNYKTFTFSKNIVQVTHSDVSIYSVVRAVSLNFESDSNLFWNPYECFLHSSFLSIKDAQFVKRYKGGDSFSDWQKSGFDKNSLVTNPLFVNVRDGDYSLKEKSPAFLLGIENIAHANEERKVNQDERITKSKATIY